MAYDDNEAPNNMHELFVELEDLRTGGYEVDVEVLPRSSSTHFLRMDISTNYPNDRTSGEYWFYDDGDIMQVL